MTARRISNDASASTKGTIYQLYVALEKCFEMVSGQKVIIEKYGDVTLTALQQIEVKRVESALTDSHLNVWQTLANWLNPAFQDTHYHVLILCTTQVFGESTRWSEWNDADLDKRLSILKSIVADSEAREQNRSGRGVSAIGESLKLQRQILSLSDAEKLKRVVSKLVIATAQPGFDELYKRLKDRHGSHVLPSKCEDFLNSLLGFVLSPVALEEKSWEIGFEEFAERKQSLTTTYCVGTRVFPTKYKVLDRKAARDVEEQNGPFVQKIREIEYEEVLPQAINDYLYASDTVTKDLLGYQLPSSSYRVFADSVLSVFHPSFRSALRRVKDVVSDSKTFYDDMMVSTVPSFPGFEQPNVDFRNGVIHMHCDDALLNLKWRLQPDEPSNPESGSTL